MTRRTARFIRRYAATPSGARYRHPSRLFGAADVGCVYLPGDLTRYFQNGQIVATPSMYQDSAGTIPVTAVGQPVGLRKCLVGKGPDLIQPSATSRPVLSNRVNLLTQTEDFTGSTSRGGLVSVSTLAGYGGAAAFGFDGSTVSYAYKSFAPVVGVAHTMSVVVRMDDGLPPAFTSNVAPSAGNSFAIVAQSDPVNPLTYKVYAQPDGTYMVSGGTYTRAVVGTNFGVVKYNSNDSRTFKVTAYQLIVTNSLPGNTYQRVNTATDYDSDTSKFPLGLSYDGVDDGSYSASTLDLTSTDKVTVLAAVRKLSDAARGMVLETGNAASNSFRVEAPPTASAAQFAFTSGASFSASVLTTGDAAPKTAVLSCVGQIATDTCKVSVNGGPTFSSATDQGTGNFGNHTLFIGRRNNASLPLNGLEYGICIIGRLLTERERKTVENFLARASGVILP